MFLDPFLSKEQHALTIFSDPYCYAANSQFCFPLIIDAFCCRGMIWLSTLVSSCQALPLLWMGGCNLMDLVVWSHQSSMAMWAAQSQWPSSGHLPLRAWPSAQWRECLLALSPFSIGPLFVMTSQGINSRPKRTKDWKFRKNWNRSRYSI